MRGFKDTLPPASCKISYIKNIFEKHSAKFGCDFIDLALVESAELYFRTSGSSSDICNKELFEVRKYRGEFEDWVLRPEATASCMRAVKEQNFMQDNKLARFCYFGPMFRYNRPQKGRYRQFLQAGWEFIGSDSVAMDFELITGAVRFIEQFDFEYSLEINTIGIANDRTKYRNQLAAVFNTKEDPLRVLDKLDSYENVPKMQVNAEDENKFDQLKALLSANNVGYVHNPYLVRGLDYYNSTVFEIKANGQTVLAGGRYDYLMQQLGGGALPAIGFAAGVERIADAMSSYLHKNSKIAVICLDAQQYAILVAEKIRKSHQCFVFWDLELKKALAQAAKDQFSWAVIIGKTEENDQVVQIKNLAEHAQFTARFADDFLTKMHCA